MTTHSIQFVVVCKGEGGGGGLWKLLGEDLRQVCVLFGYEMGPGKGWSFLTFSSIIFDASVIDTQEKI